MISSRGLEKNSAPGRAVSTGGDQPRHRYGNTAWLVYGEPRRDLETVEEIEKFIPQPLTRGRGFFLSFKNRILASTLLVIVVVVIIIGITLQIAVFPSLKGDPAVITDLKVIHFLASVVVIIISWLFIERISVKITMPLYNLTYRADQISREAGARLAASEDGSVRLDNQYEIDQDDKFAQGDEIVQLTSSFNRMLFYLKASEARLRESEEKHRFLFDNNPSPIFVMDANSMMILDVNARASEEYQYNREEFLQMSFNDLGLPRDREQTSNRLKQIFPTETTLLPVLQHRRKDGSLFMVTFLVRLTTFRHQPAIIASVWDVTERLEKHAMLIQASKMATLGEMATGIAHELNQPLNVIRLGCDYLTKKMKCAQSIPPKDLHQVTKELTNNVERASRIINHLRQFGRKAEKTVSPVDINKPILDVFTMLRTQFEAHSIIWNLDLGDGLPKILGDENQLEQVFINLVINARDAILAAEKARAATGERRTKAITVRTCIQDRRIIVTVTDTGMGIPESVRDRVFEPFFTTKRPGEGTGLGLSISYGIIKEHNGTVEIVSSQGQGTTFRLSFPALSNGDST